MKKILSLGNSPITCYPYHAHTFSIVDAYSQDYLPWLYNYYVQLVVPNDMALGFRVDFATPHITKSIPWLEKGRIDWKKVLGHWDNLADFVKECIEQNQYTYMLLNVSKISAYNGSRLGLHDPLIYGYDEESKIIYFADNYKNGKYSTGIMTYQEINDAAYSMIESGAFDWFPGIYTFSYKQFYDYGTYRFKNFYKYEFNLELFQDLVDDYLHENDSIRRWDTKPICIDANEKSNNRWGLDIYNYFIDFLNAVEKGEARLDCRGIYVFREQKEILQRTISYLRDDLQIGIGKELDCMISTNLEKTNLLLMLGLKYEITNDEKIIARMQEKIEELALEDRKFFYVLFDSLHNK